MGEHPQINRIEPDQVQPPKPQVQPPSASSSPSHDFSFTISLDNKSKPSPPPFPAIDLSPADDIFFHGHLLPLHLLSHLPVSPRSSTNSLDSFTLPIKELHSAAKTTSDDRVCEGKARAKSKSFSLFGKWRRNSPDREKDDDRKRKSSKFDLLVKRYMRFVKPFLSLGNKRGSSDEFLRQQPYSYSGNLRLRPNKKGRRGEFSAPASMITSPTNSGLLVASGSATPTSASDSTMEELQAAIQAAIAHCKKSIAVEDKIIVP